MKNIIIKVHISNVENLFFINIKICTKIILLWKEVLKMQITDVRLRKVNSENRMKAVASITFDNEFAVHDIKVIESQNGLFIAMPSRKIPNGEFKDIAHPINPETRERIQNAILEAYNAPDAEAE